MVAKFYVSKPNEDKELLVATQSKFDAAQYLMVSILAVLRGSSLKLIKDPYERVLMHSNYYSYAY